MQLGKVSDSLAWGYGCRNPWPLYIGRPLLEHTIALLRKCGVRELFINLHQEWDEIPAYFATGQKFGVRINYLFEAELSGTAGPLRAWEGDLRSGTFLVVYGDVLTDLDLGGLLRFHQARNATATIAVHEGPQPQRCGILSFNRDGRVTRFLEKPSSDQVFSTWTNAGLYALQPEVLDFIPSTGEADFGRDVFPALLKSEREVYAYQVDGYLIDVGEPDRYARAEEDLRAGRCLTYAVG